MFQDRSFNLWRPAISVFAMGLVGLINIFWYGFSAWWLLLAFPVTLLGLVSILFGIYVGATENRSRR